MESLEIDLFIGRQKVVAVIDSDGEVVIRSVAAPYKEHLRSPATLLTLKVLGVKAAKGSRSKFDLGGLAAAAAAAKDKDRDRDKEKDKDGKTHFQLITPALTLPLFAASLADFTRLRLAIDKARAAALASSSSSSQNCGCDPSDPPPVPTGKALLEWLKCADESNQRCGGCGRPENSWLAVHKSLGVGLIVCDVLTIDYATGSTRKISSSSSTAPNCNSIEGSISDDGYDYTYMPPGQQQQPSSSSSSASSSNHPTAAIKDLKISPKNKLQQSLLKTQGKIRKLLSGNSSHEDLKTSTSSRSGSVSSASRGGGSPFVSSLNTGGGVFLGKKGNGSSAGPGATGQGGGPIGGGNNAAAGGANGGPGVIRRASFSSVGRKRGIPHSNSLSEIVVAGGLCLETGDASEDGKGAKLVPPPPPI
ncbi:UNVERIFIED_CONTAM: hypothetical protein HDU68_002057 [Siphonaria sp. JEL0065]|nr:hypothetical protein HDU68_002057 [Siphonaria sp. JEL0065]